MNDSQLRSGDDVVAVEKSTRQVIAALFENLKTNAGVPADGSTRLFFPNGIELISVIVKVNVKDGVDIEVKVAGEKGVKSAVSPDGGQRVLNTSASPSISLIEPAEADRRQ